MSSINIGLGYCIAIALAFLVLLSILLLISYHCHRHLHNNHNNNNLTQPQHSNVVVLPRILFVSEDNDDEDSSTTVGLHPQVINSYPKFPYNKESSRSSTETAVAENTRCCCSICLCEYKELEMLRMMPECKHVFHLVCVDAWLKLNGSCPVCRNSPLPTPMSTPLSEVVPLSQYDRLRR